MKRVWGELVSLDPKTRTGKFRDESNDEIVSFTALPLAAVVTPAVLTPAPAEAKH
jgi:hypothetical protein